MRVVRGEFRDKGLSLLEVLVAVFIMTAALWSVQYLYVGLLRGTSQSENKQAALGAAETVYRVWQGRVRQLWLHDAAGLDESFTVEGTCQEQIYRVEVSPRLSNPGFAEGQPLSRKKLQVRPLLVRVAYEEKGIRKELELRGAVAK